VNEPLLHLDALIHNQKDANAWCIIKVLLIRHYDLLLQIPAVNIWSKLAVNIFSESFSPTLVQTPNEKYIDIVILLKYAQIIVQFYKIIFIILRTLMKVICCVSVFNVSICISVNSLLFILV